MALKAAALTAALLVALLSLAAAAATLTTTVTTTTDEESSNPFHGQCSEQMQGRQFRACQRYLRQRSGPYENDVVGRQGRGQQGAMRECCDQLMEMDRQGCGCQAIRHAMRQAQRQGPGQQMREQMYQKAQMLPQMCNMREQQCQFPVVFL